MLFNWSDALVKYIAIWLNINKEHSVCNAKSGHVGFFCFFFMWNRNKSSLHWPAVQLCCTNLSHMHKKVTEGIILPSQRWWYVNFVFTASSRCSQAGKTVSFCRFNKMNAYFLKTFSSSISSGYSKLRVSGL